jgi:hypothetical protein
LDLSENQLTSVKSFATPLPKLAVLSLAANQIPNVAALSALKESAALRQLTTTGNPLNSEDEYRLCVIHALPQLVKVDDDEEITKEDRDSAAEFVAQKLAEEEEQRRLEAEARRAEEEEEAAERRRRAAEEEEEKGEGDGDGGDDGGDDDEGFEGL